MKPEAIDYVTVIEPVFEVTLFGHAKAQIWYPYLQEELDTGILQDELEIIISAVDSKYIGIRFQEFSISVNLGGNRYFLAHAYNSISLFAWAERNFFQTPYYQGDIKVQANHICLAHGKHTLYEARLPEQTSILSSGQECDELFVQLPKRLGKNSSQAHFFYARLEGFTETYSGAHVDIQIVTQSDDRILNLLKESQFQVQKWCIRCSAHHSKSKTYKRSN